MNKAKKVTKVAAQYKKAGNSKSDAHPADARKMMSQKGGKQKRSGYMMKWMPLVTPPPLESTVLEVINDLFGSDHEDTSDTHSPRVLEEAWLKAKRIVQDIRTHSHAWGKIGEEIRTRSPQTPPDDMGFGESNVHNSDGSESDSKPPPLAVHYLNQLSGSSKSSILHNSDDSEVKEESNEAIVARYEWKRYSNELWIPARPRPFATRAVHCLNQLPEMVSESTVEEGMPTGVIVNGTSPESSEEEDTDAILVA
jgi:hypothetical protein